MLNHSCSFGDDTVARLKRLSGNQNPSMRGKSFFGSSRHILVCCLFFPHKAFLYPPIAMSTLYITPGPLFWRPPEFPNLLRRKETDRPAKSSPTPLESSRTASRPHLESLCCFPPHFLVVRLAGHWQVSV